MNAKERHADLMRQGFMKPAKAQRSGKTVSDAEWKKSLAEAAKIRFAELNRED